MNGQPRRYSTMEFEEFMSFMTRARATVLHKAA